MRRALGPSLSGASDRQTCLEARVVWAKWTLGREHGLDHGHSHNEGPPSHRQEGGRSGSAEAAAVAFDGQCTARCAMGWLVENKGGGVECGYRAEVRCRLEREAKGEGGDASAGQRWVRL